MTQNDGVAGSPRERSPHDEPRRESGSPGESAMGEPLLREPAIEALLERFFVCEMPVALRALAEPRPARTAFVASPVVASPVVESRDDSARLVPPRRGRVSVVAASLALAAGVWLLRGAPDSVPDSGVARLSRPSHAPSTTDRSIAAKSGTVNSSDPATAADSSLDFSVTERIEPVETLRFDSEHGPVEQRAERRITNVSVVDPQTGARLEVELPELTIEIIPIKE